MNNINSVHKQNDLSAQPSAIQADNRCLRKSVCANMPTAKSIRLDGSGASEPDVNRVNPPPVTDV